MDKVDSIGKDTKMNNTINLQSVMPRMLVGTDDFEKLLIESDIYGNRSVNPVYFLN